MDRTSVDQIRLQKYTQNIPSYNEITISFISTSNDNIVIEKGGASTSNGETPSVNDEEDAIADDNGSSKACTTPGTWLSLVVVIGGFLLFGQGPQFT